MTTRISKPNGRPSDYNDGLQSKADQYIYDFSKQGDVVPSRAGLCCWLGIARSTSYEWEKIHPRFSDTLEKISVLQECLALNESLKGNFNATIARLLLANHGYSDKQELAHTSPDGSMSPSTSADAVLAAIKAKHDTSADS